MGIRIEYVLVVWIVIIIAGSFTVELNSSGRSSKPFTKELEFTNTTFIEVDTHKLQGNAYGTYGIRDDGVLTLDNLIYKTETIKSLVANKGTYMGSILYLEGDVVMYDAHGYKYETQQAEYDQVTEILNITAPFVATRDNNIYRGDTLTYHTRKETVYGTVIDATIYTVEK